MLSPHAVADASSALSVVLSGAKGGHSGADIARGRANAITALARVLSSFLFGVEARDPLTFVSVAAVLIVVAFAASYVPSRRALRVDPMTALRIE